MKRKKDNSKKVEGWTDRMKGIPCFLIGCGVGLIGVDLNILKPYFTIGLNRAYHKIDPTIVVWQDLDMWLKEGKEIKKLKAVKYCRIASHTSETGKDNFYHFNLTGRESKIPGSASLLYGRGSSGAIGYQLAYILGCDPIILVGMGCRKDKKIKYTSFYGNNPKYRPMTLKNCIKSLEWIKKVSKDRRTIINCSKSKVFEEIIPIEEVIKNTKNIEPHTRKYWECKLLGKELPPE